MKKYTKAELQDMAIKSIIDTISNEELLDFKMQWFYKDSVYASEWTDWCGPHDLFSEELDLIIVPIFKRLDQRFRTGPYIVEEKTDAKPETFYEYCARDIEAEEKIKAKNSGGQ